jgi:hypothetical protein
MNNKMIIRVAGIFLMLLFTWSGLLYSQEITFTVADSTVDAGAEILLPVFVDEITADDGVVSAEFRFTSSSSVASITGIETDDTVLDGLNTFFNSTSGNFAFATTAPIEGEGVFLYLRVEVREDASKFQEAELRISSAQLNEGEPAIVTQNGLVRVRGIDLTPKSPPAIVEGQTFQFDLSGDIEPPVVWSTSDENIATISSTGLLQSLNTGTIRVYAEDADGQRDSTDFFRIEPESLLDLAVGVTSKTVTQSLEDTVQVTVSDITGLNITSGQFDLNFTSSKLEITGFSYEGTLLEGRPAPVIFQDGSIVRFAFADAEPYSGEGALVNIHFRVLRNATGTATFTPQNVLFNETFEAATSSGTITIDPAPQIILSFPEEELTIGETMLFTVSDGGTPPYTWLVDNSSIATIDETTGEFTALSRGDVNVIATDAQGFESDPVPIRVNDVTLQIDDKVVTDFESFTLDLFSTDLTGLGITSYEIDIEFDDSLLEFESISTSGTISDGISLFSSEENGVIRIAAASTESLAGEGTFLELLFRISDTADFGSSADVTIEKALFNEPGPTTPTATRRAGTVFFLEENLPETVFLIAPEQGQFNVSVRPQFSWEPAERADSYILQLSEDEIFSEVVLNISGIGDELYQPESNLEFLTQYFWRVRAESDEGVGPWSDTRSFTTEPGVAEAPVLAEPENEATGISRDAVLSWFPSLYAESYLVEVSTNQDFDSIAFSEEVPDTSATVEVLDYETLYYWRVTGINIQGPGEVSDVFQFTTEVDPGIEDPVVDAFASTVTATSPHLADGEDVSLVTVVLVDTEGNPVTGLEDDDFEIALTGSATFGPVTESSEAGTYEFEVTNEAAEEVTVTVTVDGVELDDKPVIVFEAVEDPDPVVDASASSVTATSPHLADGEDASLVTVVVVDTEGTSVTGLDSSDFVIELTGSAVSGTITEAEVGGTYEFEVTSETAGEVTVTITADGVELDDKPVIVFLEEESDFAGGDGTPENPYQIANLDQLNLVRDFLDASFIQIADIDAFETVEWNDGAGFEPIGSWTTPSSNSPFTGRYDGNGHKISSLHINDTLSDYVGLFVYIDGGEVRDLTLDDLYIFGMANPSFTSGRQEGLGAIAGRNQGTITNIMITGTIDGQGNQIGGIVGDNFPDGVIENSFTEITIANPSVFFTGGIAGINRGEILNTYSSGVIYGRTAVGGISGSNSGIIFRSSSSMNVTASENDAGGISGRNNNTIEESFSEGDVTGVENVGGLVGSSSGFFDIRDGFVINSYATGNVTGESRVGGLLGRQPGGGNTINSYATGFVDADGSFVGGLVGLNNINSSISNSYWNIETTGQTSSSTSGTIENVVGLTSYQMMEVSFYESWDLDLIWDIETGEFASYPYLRTNVPVFIPGLSIRGDFGTVAANTSSAITVEITNPLNTSISFSGFTVISGSSENLIAENNLVAELGPGETEAFELTWSPQNEMDILSTVLQVEHDSDQLAEDRFWIRLSGEAVDGDPPLVDAENSEVTATSPHVADGFDASQVTVVLVDTLGSPVTGLDDSDFVIDLTGSALAGTISESEVSGTYIFEVTNEVAEVVTVTVTADGVELDDKPEIVFEADEDPDPVVDASASSVSATSPHTADGEDASLVTVVLVDTEGDPVAGLEDADFEIELTGSAVAGPVTESSEAGTYEFEVTSETAGEVTVTVTAAGVELDDKPMLMFEAAEIVVDASASTVTATSPHLAGGLDASQVTVVLVDTEGDPVAGLENVDFEIALTGSAMSGPVTESSEAGTYEFEVTNEAAEEVTVTVTAAGVELDDKPIILFESDDPLPLPGTPEIVSVTATDEGLVLMWDVENEEFTANYIIYRGRSVFNLEPYDEVPAGTFTYSDESVIEGTSYYSVMAANSQGGESGLSEAISFMNSTLVAASDWQLVSAALGEGSVEADLATLFSFSEQYRVSSTLVPRSGYWMKTRTFDEEVFSVRGRGLERAEFDLNEGWNLIGSLADTVDVESIEDESGILSGAPVYHFDGTQYISSSQIVPNKGYWIHAQEAGIIGMEINTDPNSGSFNVGEDNFMIASTTHDGVNFDIGSISILKFSSGSRTAKIHISEGFLAADEQLQYLLPPIAPEPVLDVRTESQTSLVNAESARLIINSSEYPVSVELEHSDDERNYAYQLHLEKEGKSLTVELVPGQSHLIQEEFEFAVLSTISSDEQVSETRLYPNYPNPFNPATTIHYQLRNQSQVSIEVFDVAGRRVGLLADGVQQPGEYRVNFDASNLA